MTLHGPFPIPPVLGTMADVMSEIRHMLLNYEVAMTASPATPLNKRTVQDFDLAIQSLQDLETIARKLAAELPADLVSHSAVRLGQLQLERSRDRVVSAARGITPATVPRPAHKIDLFTGSQDDTGPDDGDSGRVWNAPQPGNS